MFLALFGCTTSAAAQTAVTRITTAAADARVLERTIDIRIEADGRMTRVERRVVEFLTDFAQETYADPVVLYDRSRQRLTVQTARTTEPDGSTQDTPPIGINELAVPELAAAPAWAELRATVVTHVGIEPGARAELAWTVEDTAPPPGGIAGAEIGVRWALPIDRFELRVSVPRGIELRHACVGCTLAPMVAESDDTRTYTWSARDLAPLDLFEISDHVGGPGDGLQTERIVFSSAVDWAAAVGPLCDVVETGSAPTDAIRDRALALTKDAPTEAQRIEALQGFVADDLPTLHPPHGSPGRLPAAAPDVLDRSYGTPADKAVLLRALLAAVGIPADVVWLAGPEGIAPDVPRVEQFDDVRVALHDGGSRPWLPLDRRGRDGAEACGGRWTLGLDGSAPTRLAPASPESNLAAVEAEVRVAEDGTATADVRLTLVGGSNPYDELRTSGDDPSARLGKAAAAFLPEGEASSPVLEVFGSDRTSGAAQVAGRLREEGRGLFTLPLPWPGGDPLPASLFRASRDTALDLEAPLRRTASYTIHIPAGWTAVVVPRNASVVNALGRFVQETVVAGDEIRIERRLEVDAARIEPAAYGGLRELWQAFVTAGAEPLVVER